MKTNKAWMNNVTEKISEKYTELKLVVLANKLHSELESKALEQVLAEHLPVAESEKLSSAAADMKHAIDEMYSGLDEKVDYNQVTAFLNSSLDGLTTDEKGIMLVNLLNCAAATNPDILTDKTHWTDLCGAESFTEENITELRNLATQTLDSNAGFLARQEFLAMEGALAKLPCATVEAQINSGPKYAEAYAAAMYITDQHTPSNLGLTPYQLGIQAANNVESSRILAMYHYGKLRAEDAIEKLKAVSFKFLTYAYRYAIAFALGVGAVLSVAVIASAVYLLTELLYSAGLGTLAIVTFSALIGSLFVDLYSPEEAAEDVSRIWSDIKDFISSVINFFRGEDPSTPPAETVEHSYVSNTDENEIVEHDFISNADEETTFESIEAVPVTV